MSVYRRSGQTLQTSEASVSLLSSLATLSTLSLTLLCLPVCRWHRLGRKHQERLKHREHQQDQCSHAHPAAERSPSWTTEPGITLSARGSTVSPHSLGAVFTRGAGRTSSPEKNTHCRSRGTRGSLGARGPSVSLLSRFSLLAFDAWLTERRGYQELQKDQQDQIHPE
ncbi:hypothetical protein EYF80_007565 [Liparis tanakae]|uniref:Uncharacterized protein n=1 Tax=Liparis tanakae TaxID=230148 RepID=A0A4Z2IWQ3_9TELE|nr:hypothetical protein EYF80_007565 [Liparis tanakae]